jgi:hypothetical protein
MKLNARMKYFMVIQLAVLSFPFLDIEDFPFMGECLDEQTGTRMLPSHVQKEDHPSPQR